MKYTPASFLTCSGEKEKIADVMFSLNIILEVFKLP
jgi:hypothetical protein